MDLAWLGGPQVKTGLCRPFVLERLPRGNVTAYFLNNSLAVMQKYENLGLTLIHLFPFLVRSRFYFLSHQKSSQTPIKELPGIIQPTIKLPWSKFASHKSHLLNPENTVANPKTRIFAHPRVPGRRSQELIHFANSRVVLRALESSTWFCFGQDRRRWV